VKVFLALILLIGFLAYLMIKRGRTMKSKFYGKSEEEIQDALKRIIP